MSLAVTRLSDGNWTWRLTTYGALCCGDSESLWNVARTRCPCWCWLWTALRDGVSCWNHSCRTQRLISCCVHGCMAGHCCFFALRAPRDGQSLCHRDHRLRLGWAVVVGNSCISSGHSARISAGRSHQGHSSELVLHREDVYIRLL